MNKNQLCIFGTMMKIINFIAFTGKSGKGSCKGKMKGQSSYKY